MGKKRIAKLILFLVIAALLFQLIPNTITFVDEIKTSAQDSKVFLSLGSVHTDPLFIGRENQKPSVQKANIHNNSIYIHQLAFTDISLTNFSFLELSFDYRKVIRQSIPQYFNGSKYKNNHFAI